MDQEQPVEIRFAGLPDIPALTPVFEEYRAFYGRPASPENTFAFLRNRVEAKESVIFIVKRDGDLLAFAQMYPSFSSLSLSPSWILNDLFVSPRARGLGFGRLLLKQVEKFSVASGVKSISLKTSKSNVIAQNLYEAYGWVRDTEFYSYDRKLE